MCGIAAILNGTIKEVKAMGKAIKNRGLIHNITEDGNLKVWFSWLPITDKSAPLQPYKAGDYSIWMNGYISNYKELAHKYSIKLNTNCDTELLAALIEKFGFDKLDELNGFFAVLAYNGKDLKTFTDRYGIKQLYQYRDGDKIFISSEVKAILAVNKIGLCEKGVGDWKYSLGVMTENTIYKGIERVKCLPFKKVNKINISYKDACLKLRELLIKSMRRNKAGVKDCVFLSGGVDSGIIAKHINPDYCFSMDYIDSDYSETENIKLNSVGKHYSIMCNRELFEEYALKTAKALDDFKAGSCYTNLALTEFASKFSTVIYSGAGGDEFFGGYPHRINKPINEVIKRTNYPDAAYDISHKEYDLRFLKAVLVVEDRMGGLYTMETRYPLLDNDLVDFALSLPEEYLENKRILKDISGLDEKVKNAKKKGFSNPHCTNEQWVNYVLKQVQ